MKIIALEEHFATAELMAAWLALDPPDQDLAVSRSTAGDTKRRLLDLADTRLAAMDDAGVDMQVLSVTVPGTQTIGAAEAVPLARATNNLIAATVRHRPDRFQGFATLPLGVPEEAARELDRAIVELGLNGAMLFGRVGMRNVDHPDLLPVLETAARLRAPLHLHPQTPSIAVRRAYYQGLGDEMESAFATAGIGWHYETGMQAVRLVLAGVFERLPDLRIILGHWGELVLFYLERLDMLAGVAKLAQPVSGIFRQNIWVTPSGMFSQRYLRWAIEVIGTDRIMFATDYLYVPAKNGAARRFLTDSALDPIDRDKVASGNWDRLVADIRR